MSFSEGSSRGTNNGSQPGHKFEHVHIDKGAKAHLGDSYHLGTYTLEPAELRALTTNLGLENPLDRLPYAEDAPFNSYTKQHKPTCLPNTRVELLQDIFEWANTQDGQFIF